MSQHKGKQHRSYFRLFIVPVLALLIGYIETNQLDSAYAAYDNPAALSLDRSVGNQILPATFIEAENTGQVSYSGSGWVTLPCLYCSGGKYRRANDAGRTATLVFNGTSISVVFVGDGKSGLAEVSLDGAPHSTINLYNNASGTTNPDPVEYVIATNLPPGQHVIQVTVTGQNGFDHRQGISTKNVGLDGFRYGNFAFGSLQGRVLDRDGDGLSGAWLTVSSGNQTYSVSAGYDGLFSLSGLPGGVYNLTASLPDYSPQTITGVVTEGSLTNGLDIILPEAAGHILYGRIYMPHMNSPAIQQAGTTLAINIKEGSEASGWAAFLSTPYNTIPLPITSTSYNPLTAWTLQATIPANTPPELYNLTVTSSQGADTQVRAVQVVSQFKDPFYFVVLGDPQAATIEPGLDTFKQIVDEINLINPAFVLVVGDLVEHSTEAEYKDYVEAINRLQVPSYGIPGNHDFAESTGVIPLLPLWKRYLGRRYYSFDYGLYHFAGMDNSLLHIIDPELVDTGGYFADQVAWAQSDLAAHQNSLLRFLFLHIIRQPGATGAALASWKPAWIDDWHTNMVLYGHAGVDHVSVSEKTPVHWVETQDMIDKRYRLVRIANGAIGPYTYDGSINKSIPSDNLELRFWPDNDGSHNIVTAEIDNELKEHFEHALLRFVMPRRSCYQSDEGTITGQVNSDDGQITVVYVTLDVPANADTLVTVSPCQGADLMVTSAGPVRAENILTYSLIVTNNGPADAPDVRLTNTLPAGVTLISVTPANNCAGVGNTIICNLATLAPGASIEVAIKVIVEPSTGGGPSTITITSSEPDPILTNNTLTLNFEALRLHLLYLPVVMR